MSLWIFAAAAVVVLWLVFEKSDSSTVRRKQKQTLLALHEYEFPRVVREVFSRENPHLTYEQRDLAFQGLKEYFIILLMAQHAGKKAALGMTSVLVDDAWHSFVLCTKEYEVFCDTFFGHMVHHNPDTTASPGAIGAEARFSPEVMNTWAAYRHAKTVHPLYFTSVDDTPLLFGLDTYASLDTGWFWTTQALLSLEQQSLDAAASVAAARATSSTSSCSGSSCMAFTPVSAMSCSSSSGNSCSSSSSDSSSGSSSSHSHGSSHSSCSSSTSSCSSSTSSSSCSSSSTSSCSSSSCSSSSCSSSSCSSSSCSS